MSEWVVVLSYCVLIYWLCMLIFVLGLAIFACMGVIGICGLGWCSWLSFGCFVINLVWVDILWIFYGLNKVYWGVIYSGISRKKIV